MKVDESGKIGLVAESGKIGLVSCILSILKILRRFSFNFNVCKVAMFFFKIGPESIEETIVTLQALRFKLNRLSQT